MIIAEVLRYFRNDTNGWIYRQYLVWCHRERKNDTDIIRRGELFWVEHKTSYVTKTSTGYEYNDSAGRPTEVSRMQESAMVAAIEAYHREHAL